LAKVGVIPLCDGFDGKGDRAVALWVPLCGNNTPLHNEFPGVVRRLGLVPPAILKVLQDKGKDFMGHEWGTLFLNEFKQDQGYVEQPRYMPFPGDTVCGRCPQRSAP
jgi:hypothetical protein